MLPQKKSLLRRNAWFRQQYLQYSLPEHSDNFIAANDGCSCSYNQPIAMLQAHSENTTTNNQSEQGFLLDNSPSLHRPC